MSLSKSIKWVHANYSKLQEKYSGKFIAVYNEKIIAASDSIDELESKVPFILENEEEYLIEFIERGDLYAYSFKISNHSSNS